jgi:2-methylcitrate dehydratase PrpD
MRLDAGQIGHALGLAATQATGLTASFGTMAKPLHAGKGAVSGLVAAELAAEGVEGAQGILDVDSKLVRTLLQDPDVKLEMAPFDSGWEILKNSFKPYAACQLTHGSIDAGRLAAAAIGDRQIESIRSIVNPLAVKIAGLENASNSTEGKFSLAFCIALGMKGYPVTTQDFTPERLFDPELVDIAKRVKNVASDEVSRTSARLEIQLSDGSEVVLVAEHAFGSIGNPMQWPDLERKFLAVTTPVIGADAATLLDSLRHFEKPGSLATLFSLSRRRSAAH